MYFKLLSSNAKVQYREYEFLPHGFLLYHIPFTSSAIYRQVKNVLSFISQMISDKAEIGFKKQMTAKSSKQIQNAKVQKKAMKEVEAIME